MGAKLHSLILAGGSGTRLWPLSRQDLPKQFLPLCGGEKTLLQQTAERLLDLPFDGTLNVVASGRWAALIGRQMKEAGITDHRVICEPVGRNTAPAIALGLAELLASGADESDCVLVCPSDHIIRDGKSFLAAVERGVQAAADGYLVTFGIVPTHPETGFGYIRASESGDTLLAAEFVEKPNLATAEKFLSSGDYYWNGGIFCFRISDMREAFRRHYPEGAALLEAGDGLMELFIDIRGESIDYAIMEKADNIACIPLDAGWSDVGSWDAVHENSPVDPEDNSVSGDVLLLDCRNSLIVGGSRLVCGVGLESMIIVDTPDALFAAPRGQSQRLREIVKSLSEADRAEIAQSRTSARDWGSECCLHRDDALSVKSCRIDPGAELDAAAAGNFMSITVTAGTGRIVLREAASGQTASRKLATGDVIAAHSGEIESIANVGDVSLVLVIVNA